jgi:hypothetical protein
LRRYAYTPLSLRFAQDKLHRKDSFFLEVLCEALWVYCKRRGRLPVFARKALGLFFPER